MFRHVYPDLVLIHKDLLFDGLCIIPAQLTRSLDIKAAFGSKGIGEAFIMIHLGKIRFQTLGGLVSVLNLFDDLWDGWGGLLAMSQWISDNDKEPDER